MGVHVFPILNPPPTSLPIPSLWVIPVHQLRASCIMHQTWTGDSFHIYYTCFNAILPNHPTLSLSHRVQKKTLKSLFQHHSSKASILWRSAFFTVQLSHPYMTTGKTIALTRRTFVGKVISGQINYSCFCVPRVLHTKLLGY